VLELSITIDRLEATKGSSCIDYNTKGADGSNVAPV